MTSRFSNQLVAELYQPFWAAWQAGDAGRSSAIRHNSLKPLFASSTCGRC